ncbi:MAG TPA: response regulator [Acidobacteriota bacterium]|nr:response regulator [Acidobacteriota bacterium]HOS99765.1 response regulator [Acidobacteriota bacterium]HQF86304.1 response regulator [Acidobacteriota bacterium]HQG90453.1 response regulator [Acidobacteriota bacterium]HQK86063.1 response regulator [Acidobacteriota bacterium]
MLKKVRILIVDDDPDVCEYLQKFLSKDGYDVTAVANPTQVLDELKNKPYQIIILDLKMPGMSGEELLRRIRAIDSDICIIIYTGYPTVDSAVDTMKQQVFDYIKKPFNIDDFRAVIRKAIEERGLIITPEARLNQEIGNKIRTLRKKKNLTLKKLANRTGLSVSLISQIELAKTSASVSTLYKIASALGIKIGYFFSDI